MAQTAQILQFKTRLKRVGGESDANDKGWIKSHRKRLEEDFSRCPIKYVVWDFLLLNATHKPHETRLGAKPVTLMPGQLITSKPKILEQFDQKLVKVTLDHVRGALDFFIREGMITAEGTRKGTIITVVNWGKYQGENESKITDFLPRQIPDTDPRQKTTQEANEYEAFRGDSPDSFPDTDPDSFPAIQEDNKYNTKHCSNNNIGSSVDEPIAKKSSSKFEYPKEFEWIWSNRPAREGSDPKRKAFHAANARIKQGTTWRELAEGMKRYTAFCSAKGWLNTCTVQQMATFFGPDEHFRNDWVVTSEASRTGSGQTLDWNDTAWAQDIDGGLI